VKQANSGQQGGKPKQTTVTAPGVRKCFVCQALDHTKQQCPVYLERKKKGNNDNLIIDYPSDFVNAVVDHDDEIDSVDSNQSEVSSVVDKDQVINSCPIINNSFNLIFLNILLFRESGLKVTTKAMLDSGSTTNLISRRIANNLGFKKYNNSKLVCFANNNCTSCSNHLFKLKFKLSTLLFNSLEFNKNLDSVSYDLDDSVHCTTDFLEAEFRIMDDMREDVILSRQVIYDFDLSIHFALLFAKSAGLEKQRLKGDIVEDDDDITVADDEILVCNNISEVNKEPIRPFLKIAQDEEDIGEDRFEDFEAFPVYSGIIEYTVFDVRAEGKAKSDIQVLLMEFRRIFSADVMKEPMQGDKFQAKINESEWFVNNNRLPPKVQSYKKRHQLERSVG
jgi:hypothetical protein